MKTVDEIYYHIRIPKDEKDFWNLNFELSHIDPFTEFSKKKISNKVMMAIYMIYDPKSQIVNSGLDERQVKKDISKNYLGDEKFDWTPFRDIVIAYKQVSKTKIEKELGGWWLQLQERDEYLNHELEWGDGQDELKEKMLLKTEEHYQKYRSIVASLKEERQDRLMYGDYTPSELEMWALDED